MCIFDWLNGQNLIINLSGCYIINYMENLQNCTLRHTATSKNHFKNLKEYSVLLKALSTSIRDSRIEYTEFGAKILENSFPTSSSISSLFIFPFPFSYWKLLIFFQTLCYLCHS